MATGRVYDELFLEHGEPWHVENRARLAAITARLQASGLWDEMEALESVPAEEEYLVWLHTEEYLEELQALCEHGGGALDADTVANWATWGAAVTAAGSCLWATKDIIMGGVDNALCLVRPPGHHALPDRGMGFCFLNNVALAAESALRLDLERVAILDWDVHHGNGTQDIFYNRGEVLFVSLHQWGLFPGTGTVDEVGVDKGTGRTLNLPLPVGAGDEHYLRAWEEVMAPALRRHRPDMIFVSAGFDGHHRDPLGSHRLTADGYHDLTTRVRRLAEELCEGRLLVVLEGGYDPEALAHSVESTVLALLDRPVLEADVAAPPLHEAAQARIIEHLDDLIHTHRTRLSL